MKTRNHSQWLGLYEKKNEITFTHSDRAEALLRTLPRPESQRPSLIVLIGNSSKVRTLKELTSTNTLTKSASKRGYGEIHLHVDPSTVFSDRPLLFAEGDFPVQWRPNKVVPLDGDQKVTHSTLSGLQENMPHKNLQIAADKLYSQLLSPFVDVFCFFVTDLGGLKPITLRIASWLNTREPSTMPAAIQSRIVIVAEKPNSHESDILDEFLATLAQETSVEPLTRFAEIQVVNLLPDGDLSPASRHRKLKEVLMAASDYTRSMRNESRTLFSAHHLATFLGHACSHFGTNSEDAFNFIRKSRIDNLPAPDHAERLIRFLSKIDTPLKLKDFAVPLIASSILLDNYPPDMHLFHPRDVFKVLYKDACYRACKEGLPMGKGSVFILPSGFVKLVEDCVSERFHQLETYRTATSVDLHRQILLRFKSEWLALHSDEEEDKVEDCVVCLRRTPQYNLPCGHCICENCVRVFGRRNYHDVWLYEVDSCFWCGSGTDGVVVKIMPPTAGVRVLTIDGGGIRGLDTLEYLQLLQDTVNLPYPIQENFDLVFGTSIGGIIAVVLCIMGRSVEQCITRLEHFAEQVFQPRPSSGWRFLDFLISFFADARYPAENLEAALQEEIGSDRKILDCSKATAAGTRIGLPVVTIRDTSTCIFTNYNGVGTRPQGSGRSSKYASSSANFERIPYSASKQAYFTMGDASTSEVVCSAWLTEDSMRCASAAPSYFTPKYISGIGTFQDGGLRHNDPGKLALEEVAAIYPDIDEPSLVVSLGTGSPRMDEPRMSPTRGIFKDGFIPRLFRAFKLSMSSIDGHRFRSRRRKARREQYFRFNVEYDGPEPALDDTTKMQELREAARSTFQGSEELKRLSRCIIAAYFVFELECKPVKEHGKYVCIGHIFCRLRANHPAFRELISQLLKRSAKFLLQGNPVEGVIGDGSYLDTEGNFRKRVTMELHDEQSCIEIQLQEGGLGPSSISGSPFRMNSLIASQQLDAYFGTSYHTKRKSIDSIDTSSRKRQRL